jgi:mannan endo-1,4-beta-mannosidase
MWQAYMNDPTILSWNLINEPRCDAIGCNVNILSWIEEMAPYLKAQDPNHLVTVGAPPGPLFIRS